MASRPAASVRSSRGTPSEMRPGDTSFYTAACERDCGARERRSRCVPAVTEASTGSGGDVERERIVEAAVAEFALTVLLAQGAQVAQVVVVTVVTAAQLMQQTAQPILAVAAVVVVSELLRVLAMVVQVLSFSNIQILGQLLLVQV